MTPDYPVITVCAENAAYFTRLVIVVDGEGFTLLDFCLFAESTSAALPIKKFVILFRRDAVFPL